jgi:hypothetical protein
MIKTLLAATAVALILAAPAASALAQTAPAAATAEAGYQRDRQAILGMAGNFRVRFDFRETTPFVAGYEPIDDKVSGGYESVRVIEDSPIRISLQHILVVDDHGKSVVVKHWRQDWTYQPKEVLTYQASGKWVLTPLSDAERNGAWSQTVWQTDDSPRYGAVGRWAHDNGVSRWMSGTTLRPLARRDAVRHPVYDRYVGTNRHALTPQGWVQEQDNAKVGLKDGKPVTFVHEVVTNTYTRNAGFPVKAADDYWAATQDYWAAVRAAWDEAAANGHGVTVTEEAESGSVTGPRLMGLAEDIQAGKTTTAKAVAEARALIASAS